MFASRLVLGMSCAVMLSVPSIFAQEVAYLYPSKDNTLYEPGSLTSNGAGQTFYAGVTNNGRRRRAVLNFDIMGNLPAGSTIIYASLDIVALKDHTPPPALDVTLQLQRALQDWGEGSSDAGSRGGGGAPATDGDTTWQHTFYPGSRWTTPGGDFSSIVSSNVFVTNRGRYTFDSTDELITDVQDMLDNPKSNFGWGIIAEDENPTSRASARQIASREHVNPDIWPLLVVYYLVAPEQAPNRALTGFLRNLFAIESTR